jgi:hypothetical protein
MIFFLGSHTTEAQILCRDDQDDNDWSDNRVVIS